MSDTRTSGPWHELLKHARRNSVDSDQHRAIRNLLLDLEVQTGNCAFLDGEIARQAAVIAGLHRALNAKQAKIDALMLEFCPGEMSAEQRAEWARHQRPGSPFHTTSVPSAAGDVATEASGPATVGADRLAEIRQRDADSAVTWFKEPAIGACGRAFIDRRWLLGEVERLRSKLQELATECAACGGSGEIKPDVAWADNGSPTPCHECEDIRAVLSSG